MLDRVGADDTPAVGVKAAALGELLRSGLNVPPGVVLTTAAYAELVKPLQARIDARVTSDVIMDPAEIETAAAEIRGWIAAAPWSSSLRADLETALAGLHPGAAVASYAARTSLPSQDLATAFGSGVERAYLGLVGADEVLHAAARSWGALWNSRAMYYRHRKKIPQTGVALAVLVQPMITADAAGVLYTRNPMTDDPDQMQIDSIWGLGAPLMAARMRPDRFIFSRQSNAITDRELEEKIVKLVVGETGHTEQQAVDSRLSNAPSLDDSQVLRLVELGNKIEDLCGGPQDIEWARVGEALYVLQARPSGMRAS